ncbi:MAG: peptidase domain-containing ABC transporter [Bacteroidota bacterium]
MINTIKKYKAFPFIKQRGMMECVTTCLAMIFKYYGFYNIQRVLGQLARVDTQGTNLYTLSQLASKFGFKTEGYQLEYKYLMEIPLPCIAHYEGNHFVVIYKATHDQIWIADPAFGKDCISREAFEGKWNGVVLTMEATDTLFQDKDMLDIVEKSQKENASLFNRFYAPILKPRKKLIFQILGITFLLQLAGLALPLFTQSIVDEVLVHNNKKLLFSILLGMGLIFLVQIIFLYIRNILLVQFKIFIEHDFFSTYFWHFISLTQDYFDRHKREDFINRFRENMRVRRVLNPALLQAFIDLIFILLYIPVLLWYNLKLGLVAMLLTFIFLLVAAATTTKIRSLVNKVFFKDLVVLGKFLDVLLGISSLKLLGIEQIKFISWKNEYKRNLNSVLQSEHLQSLFVSIQRGMYFFSQIAIFWLGAYWVFLGEMSLGQYLAFISIFTIVLNTLNNISFLWIQMADLSVSIARLNDVLVQKTEASFQVFSRPLSSIQSLEVRNMSFQYSQNNPKPILKSLNLQIHAGEKIGLVGRNGAGKTTLVKLLLNLYPNYQGQIVINGQVELRKISLHEVRKRIFLFPQDIYVFSASIRENILYANPSASQDEIIRAAELADLHDYIKTQHLGYNQIIGDEGSKLSGGQVLKLGFARLFLSNPDIIILDEASSQLDVETEARIMQNLYEKFQDKIIISIAHRINTLKNSDRILVMDEGSIVEEGNHEQLMRKEGLYHQFMKTYVSY